MPFIPTVPMTMAPEPSSITRYPWRFTLGQHIYVLGNSQETTFIVIGGELWMGWPHLHVLDSDGKKVRVPQIHCSSKPIVLRGERT